MENLTQELIKKAKMAKSAEELLSLAKEDGVEMTVTEAAAYFAQLNPKSGELDDDELDNVAGGACAGGEANNKDLFPVGSKIRYKYLNCKRCGENALTVKGSSANDCSYLTPVCDCCGAENGNYLTGSRNMSEIFELI